MATIYGTSHVVLTSHPGHIFSESPEIEWGHTSPLMRGPIVASLTNLKHRNAIGTHSGSYAVYRALSTAAGAMDADHKPDLTNTAPVWDIQPSPAWSDPEKIVSLDPWGAHVHRIYADAYKKGYDIRPTIAITRGHINVPEIGRFIEEGSIQVDGKIVTEGGDVTITKAAVEPVWYLPGIAKRIGVDEENYDGCFFRRPAGCS